MRRFRVERLLAGTALAAVLSLSGAALAAAPDTDGTAGDVPTASIHTGPADAPSAEPVPAQSDSAQSSSSGAAPAAATAADSKPDAVANVDSQIPMPDIVEVAPPTAKDFDAPQPTVAEPAKAIPAEPKATATNPVPPVASTATGKDLVNVPIASTVAAADVPVAERLRELTATKLDKYVDRKADRAAVEVFYRDRGFAPLWIDNAVLDARGKTVIARLRAAESDGLDPSDYTAPSFAGDADALAQAELKLTNAMLDFVRHLQSGRIHYSHIGGDIEYALPVPKPADALQKISIASDAAAAIDTFQPPHEGYKLLKAKLAEIRKTGNAPVSRIATGKLLKVGIKDPRVPELRERLGISGDAGNTTYDAALSAAVKEFQQDKHLKATGHLSNATVEALNGPKRDHVGDIIAANMERWRWLPHDLGKFYVMVNLPDFKLKVVHNGVKVWSTKIVAGKPSKATPLLSTPMQYMVINPTWYVPQSIIYNEYLPALEQDPTVLQRMGLVVERSRDGSIAIRQPPGADNALGRMKFAFPNKFSVYLHDTPDKNLFGRNVRAYSHGCMRVEDPAKFGEVIASYALPRDHWTAEAFKKRWGGAEDTLKLANQPMVHLTYQTAFVDDAGKLQIRDDMYGIDKRMIGIMKGSERTVADTVLPARHQKSYAVNNKRLENVRRADRLGPGDDRNSFGGGNFFERLFR